jgi:hypothetical protein
MVEFELSRKEPQMPRSRSKVVRRSPYVTDCPECGAPRYEACFGKHGKRRATAHSARQAAAQAPAAKNTPRTVECPSCAAKPGEGCMAMSISTPTKKNPRAWKYKPFNRPKKFYCTARWALFDGGTFLDSQDSAADSGIWASDLHESATENGLLFELDGPAEVGSEEAPHREGLSAAEKKAKMDAFWAVKHVAD